MPPQAAEIEESNSDANIGTDPNWKMEIIWPNVIAHLIINAAGLYGLYLCIFWASWKTTIWFLTYGYFIALGVTAGAHRLFTHKCYKTVFPVRVAFILMQAACGQNSMYTWVRDHRQHHKFTDTDADPHNATRGFFFAHMGWLMVKKHPAVIAYGKKLDMSDLKADPLIAWQKKYYIPVFLALSIALPVRVPMYFWHETLQNSFFIACAFRYVLTLHTTWMTNSNAHMYGMQPYNKEILATEAPNWISFLMAGEQYHNYHHSFPRDYRASELGVRWNLTTLFIDMLSFLGLVYDLRTTPDEAIRQRILKTGDGSYSLNGNILKSLSEK